LVRVFSSDLGVEASSTADFQAQVEGRAVDMNYEQREKRKLAKRIVKAIQPALEDALRKESELLRRPFAQQMKEMDEMMFSRRASLADSLPNGDLESAVPAKLTNCTSHSTPTIANGDGDVELLDQSQDQLPNGHSPSGNGDTSLQDVSMQDDVDEDGEDLVAAGSIAQLNGELTADAEQTLAEHTPPASTNGIKKDTDLVIRGSFKKQSSPTREPPTPPISIVDNQQVMLVQGGIPWYVEQFDPEGTTVHEERWTGPEVLREMSEELSEMDEEELQGLRGKGFDEEGIAGVDSAVETPPATAKTGGSLKKNGKKKRRWTGFK
jgi:NuA3 HAT complex component NTO1